MAEWIDKIKSMKNATQEQVDAIIKEQSYKNVIKDLKEAGISESELSEEEFDQLMAEEIKKNKSFAKGAMVATGALLILELLG